jgi:predicted HTH domain antitoxin
MGVVAMETVAVRIPKDIEEELRLVVEREGLDRSTALRKMLEKGLKEWKKELALQLLREGKVTLWKAAEVAGVTIWEMLELVEEEGISLPIRAEDVIEDIRAALREEG